MINTSIKKATKAGANDHVIFLCSKASDLKQSGLGGHELKYVQAQMKDKKNITSVNQYSRTMWVVLKEDKKNQNTILESLRKSGSTICANLNKIKAKSVTLISACKADETLALAEGISLANYQFLKYFIM